MLISSGQCGNKFICDITLTGREWLIQTWLIHLIHLIQRFCEYLARLLSFHVLNAWSIQTWLIQSSTNLK